MIEKGELKKQTSRRRPASGILWGLLLIVLGAYFMLRQLGVLQWGFNWWALFIYIPALGLFSNAWDVFWKKRRFSTACRGSLGSGMVVFSAATILLLDLSWGVYWPLMVIAGGFSVFLSGFVDQPKKHHASERNWTLWNLWVGFSAMLLGVVFQGQRLALWDPELLFGSANWWALFVALPGLGAVLHALVIAFSPGRHRASSLVLSLIGVACLTLAVIAWFGLAWNLVLPIALIAGGAVFILDTLARSVVFKETLE